VDSGDKSGRRGVLVRRLRSMILPTISKEVMNEARVYMELSGQRFARSE
jgi:hypothetical protein